MSFKTISPIHDITTQNSQEARNWTNIVFIKPIEITGKITPIKRGVSMYNQFWTINIL